MKYILSIFLVTFFACSAWAESSPYVVLAGSVPPYHFEQNNIAVGPSVEILQAMFERMGLPFSPEDVRFPAWARAQKETREKPNRIIIGMALTEERKPLYKWVGPITTLRLGLVARKKDKIRILDPLDLFRYRIGTIGGGAPESILRHTYNMPLRRMVALNKDRQQMLMLNHGRVDLITHAVAATPILLRQEGLNPDDFEMVYVLKESGLYYALSSSISDQEVTRFQEAFDAVMAERKETLGRTMDVELLDVIEGAARQ